MEELEITIDSEGTTNIRVRGVKGSRCLDLTKAIENQLGQVEERIFTPEYYKEEDRLAMKGALKKDRIGR